MVGYSPTLDEAALPTFSDSQVRERFCLTSEESVHTVSQMLRDRVELYFCFPDDAEIMLNAFFKSTDSLWLLGEVWGFNFPHDVLVESEVCQVKKACPDIWKPEWEPGMIKKLGLKGELSM
ncbi:MAG: hypothetical protein Q7S53_04690 [bacterium]|nr:hypothetical protein [bacterium]